jgi:FkbM family methyltransferase
MTTFPLPNILAADDHLVVVDGGARNGPKDLVGIEHMCRFHCFEPNPDALGGVEWSVADEIKAVSLNQVTVYPFALCRESGSTTLNISARPGASSTLEPDRELLERFDADNFSEMKEIVKRVPVPAISMADFMTKASIGHVDFMKLDTQGNELDILKSAGDAIEAIQVIMTEVEFIPLYKGQALFHDVSAFLHRKGFELVDVRWVPSCRRFHARPDLPPSAYRLVWGDAIFARKPADASKPRALQQGLVLAGLGYADMAIDLFDRNPTLDKAQKQQLENYARWAAEPQWRPGKWKRMVERIFGLLIHRYNWKQGHQVRSLLGRRR